MASTVPGTRAQRLREFAFSATEARAIAGLPKLSLPRSRRGLPRVQVTRGSARGGVDVTSPECSRVVAEGEKARALGPADRDWTSRWRRPDRVRSDRADGDRQMGRP
jgi:hypothetical protein